MTKHQSESNNNLPFFGVCTYADADYAVYSILGARSADGAFVRVANPSVQFPNNGCIRILLRALRLTGSSKGNVAFFHVEEDPHFETHADSPRGMKFRATDVQPAGRQVVYIEAHSDQPDQISEVLRDGLSLLGEPSGRTEVMLETRDRALIGPLKMRLQPDSGRYKVEEQSILTVSHGWKRSSVIKITQLHFEHRSYRFVFDQKLPPSDFLIDLAPPEFGLRRAIEFLVDAKITAGVLTKNKAQELALSLSKIDPPAELKARCDRLLHYLKNVQSSNDTLREFIDAAVQTPLIQRQIAKETENARQQARAEVELELANLRVAIQSEQSKLDEVRLEKESAEERLLEIEGSIEQQTTQLASFQAKLDQRIQEQIDLARTNAEEIIASVSFLRPLLQSPRLTDGSAESPTTAAYRVAPLSWRTSPQISKLVDLKSAIELTAHNLSTIGLFGDGPRIASCSVAALLTGNAISFCGSLADETARAIAASLFGQAWAEMAVTVGLDTIARPPTHDEFGPSPLVLLGANRSCLDAYARELTAPHRACAKPPYDRAQRLALTLYGGASALALSPQYLEIGPVFHTDALRWSPCSGNDFRPGQFCVETPHHEQDFEPEEDLVREVLRDCRNVAIERTATSALQALAETERIRPAKAPSPSQVTDEALAMLTAWWLAPALASVGKGREYLQPIETRLPDNQNLRRALETWFPEPSTL